MARSKPAWTSMLPGGRKPSEFTLDELRNFKELHDLLTERLPGPPAFSYLVQSFRFLQLFAIVSITEGQAPSLQRASSELEMLFGSNPAFEGLRGEKEIVVPGLSKEGGLGDRERRRQAGLPQPRKP